MLAVYAFNCIMAMYFHICALCAIQPVDKQLAELAAHVRKRMSCIKQGVFKLIQTRNQMHQRTYLLLKCHFGKQLIYGGNYLG